MEESKSRIELFKELYDKEWNHFERISVLYNDPYYHPLYLIFRTFQNITIKNANFVKIIVDYREGLCFLLTPDEIEKLADSQVVTLLRCGVFWDEINEVLGYDANVYNGGL